MTANKRILIVDDDKVVLELFAKVAERLGAEAVAVSSVAKAKARLEENSAFTLILVDLIMPNESGWDLLDEIKRNQETADIPVIVTTGATLSQKEMDKLLLRACAVVSKGAFDLDKFRKLLDGLL